jgi:hypothetical protein
VGGARPGDGLTRVRKAIVSMGTGPQRRLLRLARTTVGPYARRHGYDLHLHEEVLDPSRPAPWSKVVALERLQDRYDLLLWLDADLMVVDPRRDLEAELPADRAMGLVEHRLRDGSVMPNTGVWALRTGATTAAFLREVWAQEDLVAHRWWENAAVCRLLGYELEPLRAGPSTPWREQTAFLDPRWNVTHDAPAPPPHRIRHYPGYKLPTRAAFMLRDLAVSRRHR